MWKKHIKDCIFKFVEVFQEKSEESNTCQQSQQEYFIFIHTSYIKSKTL